MLIITVKPLNEQLAPALIVALGVMVHDEPKAYPVGKVAVIRVVTSRVCFGTTEKVIYVEANIVGV